jgi:hypothetical protein
MAAGDFPGIFGDQGRTDELSPIGAFTAMTESDFWAIIATLDWKREGDDEAVIAPAVARLAAGSEKEILDFEEQLAAALFALDTEEHAREIGEYAYTGPDEPFSADLFLYARCVVVANGRDFNHSVLRSPSRMPRDMEFEALLRIGREAFTRLTGSDLHHVTRVSYETFSNRGGWTTASPDATGA